jgi:hypothetical protein
LNCYRTADRARWAIEGCKESIAGGPDLSPAKSAKFGADERVVARKKIAPAQLAA